jgi:hypothetical protein
MKEFCFQLILPKVLLLIYTDGCGMTLFPQRLEMRHALKVASLIHLVLVCLQCLGDERGSAPANSVIRAELFPVRIYTFTSTYTYLSTLYMFIKPWHTHTHTPSNSIPLSLSLAFAFQQAVSLVILHHLQSELNNGS